MSAPHEYRGTRPESPEYGACIDCGQTFMWHELVMMGDPGSWPRWPVLPLKNTRPSIVKALGDVGFAIGVMVDGISPVRVFHTNMFLVGLSDDPLKYLEGVPSMDYPDHQAAVMDGWYVD